MANELLVAAGFDTEGLLSAVWPGGETEALTRLERHLERKVRPPGSTAALRFPLGSLPSGPSPQPLRNGALKHWSGTQTIHEGPMGITCNKKNMVASLHFKLNK